MRAIGILAMFVFFLILGARVGVGGAGPTSQPATQPSAASRPSGSGISKGVNLKIESDPTFTSGGVNVLTATVENNGVAAVDFDEWNPLKGATIQVMRGGSAVGPTALYKEWRQPPKHGGHFLCRLQPKQSMRTVLNLSQMFDLSLSGTYEIRVSWDGKFVGSGEAVSVSAEPISVYAGLAVLPGSSQDAPANDYPTLHNKLGE